jgi:S-DNA-T family DNA segregation ATPase FtsK/SpoIIIE
VTSVKARTRRAAALHRQAAATAAAAATALEATRPAAADQQEQHDLAERLRASAAALTPGWLGAGLDAQSEDIPLGGPGMPAFVRIGTAQPLDDARFPAMVPLLGTGHLTIDADARDPRISGLLRAVLLRLLAAAPAGSLLVRAVDAAGAGTVFAPFAPLTDAGLLPPPATDRTGLRAVIAEAEQWIRPARPAAARHRRRDRTLLLVIASMPELTEGVDLARIAALAQDGPEAGLHLIVAGWPPPPLTAETTQPPLPRATMIALRNPYALVGDPPGGSFGSPVPHLASTGLNSPVFVDDDPPAHLIDRVCRELAARFEVDSRPTLDDLLPDEAEGLWVGDVTDDLTTTVGHDGDRAVTLRFNELTPHWLVSGRPGGGRTAFLVNVLYGLCTRYRPDDLAVYLLDLREGASLTEFVPTERNGSWLPHARAVGMECDREYVLAVLRELDAELTRRATAAEESGATRFAELRDDGRTPPRILCVIDEFHELLTGDGRVVTETARLIDSVARRGRSYGVHLLLAGRPAPDAEAPYAKRDALFGQFPVRIALPGGGDVLEPTNDAAAGLPLGTAVVNTAGGLGGPRGATRGHERVVRFPDPHADRPRLAALRSRLWLARDAGSEPPPVYAGFNTPRLADDPAYRAALAGHAPTPTAAVGRVVDVRSSTAGVALDPSQGAHLAVLGPGPLGVHLLDCAARSVAAFHARDRARFVIASLVADADQMADSLSAELAGRHEVERVDGPGLVKALDLDQPGYLLVLGMDALGTADLPSDQLRAFLRTGPARGAHLLSWWRKPRRFADAVGGGAGRDTAGRLVLLQAPVGDLSGLLDRPVEWPARPNRALLLDPSSGRTTPIVPFGQSSEGSTR